jgi:flagellar FliL protein
MADAPTEAPRAKKKRMLPLLLLATGVIVGGSSVVGTLLAGAETAAGEPDGAAVEEARPPGEPGVVALEPFVLNLADPEGDRYLRLTLSIAVDRAEVAERAASELEQTRLRDLVLTVLGAKLAEEITSFEGKEALRAELRRALAPYFEGARVLDVFFTEFLVQ